LLTEFTVEGFDRLTEAMSRQKIKDADDELQAAGLGYIQFAMRWPEHFRVMWRSALLDEKSPRLQRSRERATQCLREALTRANAQAGTALAENAVAARFEVACCSVHGYATLWVEGSRNSRSLDEARRMLRSLRPSLVTR